MAHAGRLVVHDASAVPLARHDRLLAAWQDAWRIELDKRDDVCARVAGGLRQLGGGRCNGLGMEGRAALFQEIGTLSCDGIVGRARYGRTAGRDSARAHAARPRVRRRIGAGRPAACDRLQRRRGFERRQLSAVHDHAGRRARQRVGVLCAPDRCVGPPDRAHGRAGVERRDREGRRNRRALSA